MKVEPVAYLKTWTRDGEERKRVDLYPEPDAWMDSFKATPLYAIPPGYALVRVEQVKDAREIVAKEYAADRHNARLYKAMDLLDMVLTAAAKGE